MMLRKWCSIIGFLLGSVYTAIGMLGAYKMPNAPAASTGELVMQFFIFWFFTGAFFAALGLGVGLLLEGLVRKVAGK